MRHCICRLLLLFRIRSEEVLYT
ncbi:hypothetical protein F383_16762 [Gossypium arboreum]|uniref:Uncharacterized protein n=1 Tax=Gossypium arboreum TaxID=29729 RepID=A0A0B0MG22_GOSAR|nr:hypothetical protein F383_38611 [Gossypium arboreum]KHG14415.1 hypothetical protein F383_16762 [Gossypium arboreum]